MKKIILFWLISVVLWLLNGCADEGAPTKVSSGQLPLSFDVSESGGRSNGRHQSEDGPSFVNLYKSEPDGSVVSWTLQ